MRGVPELLSNPRYWKNTSGDRQGEPSEEIMNVLLKEMEKKTIEKVEKDYPRWVLNQALVSFCTIMDSFLDSILDALFRHNPKMLYGISGAKNVELKRLVELGSVEAVVEDIRTKEIRSFSNESIAERLDYFQRKFNIETKLLFDWDLTEKDTDRRLENLNLDSLVMFYEQRHDIVHRDATPISTLDELDLASLLFTNVGWKLAWRLHKQHDITLDFLMWVARHIRYQEFKLQESS